MPPDLHDYLIWLARRLADDADEGLEPIVRRALAAFGQPNFVVLAHEALDAVVRAGTAALGPAQDTESRDVRAQPPPEARARPLRPRRHPSKPN